MTNPRKQIRRRWFTTTADIRAKAKAKLAKTNKYKEDK